MLSIEEMEEWHIDINFKNNFIFSNRLKKRLKQDIIFLKAIEEIEEIGIYLENSSYVSFKNKEKNDFFCSFSIEDEKEIIGFQEIIIDILENHNLMRFFYIQRD